MRYQDFKDLNAEILAISTDSVYAHKVWNETELTKLAWGGWPYLMLTDPAGKIGKMYDVYDEEGGIDFRGTFIIDPEGNVQSAEIMPPGVGRSTDELIRKLKATQAHLQSGQLMPADWNPGESTLERKTESAGRIWENWVVPK